MKSIHILIPILSFIISFHFVPVQANNSVIIGIVTDSTGKPIPYAEVYFLDTETGTTTNRDGQFIIKIRTNGEKRMQIQHSAYKSKEVKIADGDNDIVKIILEPRTYHFAPLIVEGNLYAKERLTIPVSHSLIPINQFQNSGNSVAESLDRFGIQMKDYGGAAGLKTVASPTGYGEHILVMMEGFPLNSPQNGGFDFSFLPADLFNQGEFYWGHGSSLYGSNAVGGTINLIIEEDEPSYLRIRSGSFDEKGLSGKASKTFGSIKTSIYGNRYRNIGSFRENNDFSQTSFGTQISLRLGRLWTAQYFGFKSDVERGISGSIQYPSPTARKKNGDWIHLISIRGLSSLGQSEILMGTTFANEHFTNPDWLVNSKHHINTQRLRVVHRFPTIGYFQNTFILEFIQNQVNSDDAGNHNEFLSAIGLLTQIRLRSNLFLIPNLRNDLNHNLQTSITTGSLALLMRMDENILRSISANIGTSYRNPTFNDLYWEDPSGFSTGNPNLKSERGTSTDLSLEFWPFDLEVVRINMRGYHFFTKNLIQWTPDENWIYSPQNLAKTESFGVVLNVDISPNNAPYQIKIGSEQNRSQVLSKGAGYRKRLLYVPTVSHWGEITFRTKIVELNCSYRFLGKRRYSYAEQKGILDPYSRLDIILKFRGSIVIGIRPVIDIGIRNLQNHKNQESVYGYPEPGRTLFSRLSLEFH